MRAFVVDDDADFREIVRELLEGAGFDVHIADDGLAALAGIRHVIPDLIVLDLRMPNLGGADVLKLLRSTDVGRQIPVVVTTGGTVDDTVRALATAVLVKPFSMQDLLRVTADVTAGASSRSAS